MYPIVETCYFLLIKHKYHVDTRQPAFSTV